MGIDTFFADSAFVEGLQHATDASLHIHGHHQHIVAGKERSHAHIIIFRNAFHIESIGKHQPVEAHFMSQQTVDYHRRERCAHSCDAVECRHIQMSHHHAAQSGFHIPSERIKVDIKDIGARTAHRGQCFMRILIGVAMTREMLGTREHTGFLEAGGIGNGSVGHGFLIIAVGATPYHGIIGIAIDIYTRREIHAYAHSATLTAHLLAVGMNEPHILHGTKRHIHRETGRVAQSHIQAPLAIYCHHYGVLGGARCSIVEFYLLGTFALIEQYSAHAALSHIFIYLNTRRVHVEHLHHGHHQLSHALAHGHLERKPLRFAHNFGSNGYHSVTA